MWVNKRIAYNGGVNKKGRSTVLREYEYTKTNSVERGQKTGA
jgi:hypothetical protein